MSNERETLASNFADAGARGLLDIKFFVSPGEGFDVDSLRAAVNKSDAAIRDERVTDFEVDDAGRVVPTVEALLYSFA